METIASLLAEKTQAAIILEQVTAQNVSLSGDVEALKVDRGALQQRSDSFHDEVASLEDKVQQITIEKEQVVEKLQISEADLESTVRLQQESVAAQTAAHDNDLAHRDGVIDTLTEEKSSLQKELAKVSQKLVDNDTESNGKVEMLQNELAYTREEFSVMEHKEKQLRSDLEATKMHYAKSVAYAAEQEEKFKTKISEVESAKEATVKELGETKALLAENKGTKEELESKRAGLVEQLRGVNNDLYEKNASLTANVKASEESKAKLDLMKKERASVKIERDEFEAEMKANIEALEKENASLREESCEGSDTLGDTVSALNDTVSLLFGQESVSGKSPKSEDKFNDGKDTVKSNHDGIRAHAEKLLCWANKASERPSKESDASVASQQPSPSQQQKQQVTIMSNNRYAFNPPSSSSSDISSPWNPSPIKPVDEPPQNTTFGADDTFDESMFLPNIDDNVNKTLDMQEDRTATPPTDENSKTPSKTPFKEKRALFSPTREKTKTPARRMTRRMTRSMNKTTRTPLGKSAVQNTPSSSCRVRTNWSNKPLF